MKIPIKEREFLRFFCNYFWKKKKIETGSNSKVLEYVKIKKIGAERPHSKFMKQPCLSTLDFLKKRAFYGRMKSQWRSYDF